MACKNCGKDVPEILAECPFCGTPVTPGFDGNVLPPRRKKRDWWSDLQERWRERAAQANLWLNHLSERSRFFSWLSPTSSTPWEVIFSLCVPGAGQAYWRRFPLGFLFFLLVSVLAGVIAFFASRESDLVFQIQLFVLAILLGGIHSHAFSLGQQRRLIPFRPQWLVSIIVLVVVFFQLQYLTHYAFVRTHGDVQLFRLRGYDLFSPWLRSGDLLGIAPMNSREITNGDIIRIDRTLTERVLGLGGDIVELRKKSLYRNKILLTASQSSLVWPGSSNVPDYIAGIGMGKTRHKLNVPPGQLAYMYWGRELRTVPIASCQGIISEIIAPHERAGLFINGILMPANQK